MKKFFKSLAYRVSNFFAFIAFLTAYGLVGCVALVAICFAIGYPVSKYQDYRQAKLDKQAYAKWTAYAATPEYKHQQALYIKWLGREK